MGQWLEKFFRIFAPVLNVLCYIVFIECLVLLVKWAIVYA